MKKLTVSGFSTVNNSFWCIYEVDINIFSDVLL